ncbi:hypothetical protein HDU91_001485, partial [Kappamyces sp. JEL0680]
MAYFIESQWHASDACSGAPQAMFLFSVSNPLEHGSETVSDIFPIFYQLLAPVYPFFSCGGYMKSLGENQQCCHQSLVPQAPFPLGSGGVQSALDIVVPSTELTDEQLRFYSKAEMASSLYCHLTSAQPAALAQFASILLLNDGSCTNIFPTQVYVSCNPEAALSVYGDATCTTSQESIPLTAAGRAYNSSVLGTFQGKTLSLQDGKQHVGWINIEPHYLMAPLFTGAIEIAGLVCFVFSAVSFTVSIWWRCWNYLRNKQKLSLLSVATQSVWLLHCIISMYYSYSPYTSDLKLGLLLLGLNVSGSFATYASVFSSLCQFHAINGTRK